MPRQIPSSYEALLAETLPTLDEIFAKENRPVHERPLQAARFIVDHMIVQVAGDTKDNYLSKTWFVGILHPVVRWYEQRYGSELPHPRHPAAHGLVSHFGALYVLRVDLIVSEKDGDGHRWVRFPKEVLPAEEPLNWLVSPPPLATMKTNRRVALAAAAKHVAKRLRCINNDLNTATQASAAVQRMATSVIRHLDKAALDAASSNLDSHSLVPWELQMACEKTMKVYLKQSNSQYPENHDLRALNKLSEPTLNWSEGRKSLAAFPSDTRVMKWRYSELAPPTAPEMWRMYGAAVELVSGYASRMSREFTFTNFAVKLKKAPWH